MLDQIDIIFLDDRLKENAVEYQTTGSAGFDVRAAIKEPMVINVGEPKLVPLGFSINIKNPNYCAWITPRSGLALKSGITVLNGPGLIDSDYQAEVGVILINHSEKPFIVRPMDRIAQMVFMPVESPVFNVVNSFETDTGRGGFGHSGVK